MVERKVIIILTILGVLFLTPFCLPKNIRRDVRYSIPLLRKSGYLSKEETPLVKYITPITCHEKKSGITGIDCIYAINLDERVDKWQLLQQELRSQGLLVNRVSAVSGWQLSEEQQKELFGPYPVRMIPGQMGAVLSHFSVYKDALEREFDVILLLEDDVQFIEPASQIGKLLEEVSLLDPNWDLCFTDRDFCLPDGTYMRPERGAFSSRPDQSIRRRAYYLKRTTMTCNLQKIRSRWGAHSILISKRGLKKLVDYFSHVYLWDNIDNEFPFVPDIRMYACTRDLTRQNGKFLSDNNYNFLEHKS